MLNRRALVEVADAVLAVAAGGAVLPPALVASIVTQWRSGWRGGQAGPDQKLTLREMEVLNAMADGLSTKAAARLLGVRKDGGKPQDPGVRQAWPAQSSPAGLRVGPRTMKVDVTGVARRLLHGILLHRHRFITNMARPALPLTDGEQGADPGDRT